MSARSDTTVGGPTAGDLSAATPSGLERWLGSWPRRQVLVWSVVLAMCTIYSSLVADAMESMGRPLEFGQLFLRRLVDWGLWALLFEPLARFTWFLAERLALLPQFLLHAVTAVVLMSGVGAVEPVLVETVVGPPPSRGGRREARPDEERTPAELEARAQRAERRSERGRGGGPGRSRIFRVDRGMLAYLTLLVAAASIRAYLLSRRQERRSLELQRELAEARLTNLRHQIHPHFLFNSLHSVGGLIREGRSETALNTLADLGQLLRAGLEQEEQQEVELASELELVEHYLEIEKLRLGERLESTVRVESGLGRTLVPSLVLLPVVENAIKYGIAPRAEGGELEIHIVREGECVRLEVLDDGPGFSAGALEEIHGASAKDHAGVSAGTSGTERRKIGLSNTRRRLEMLHGAAGRFEVSNRDAHEGKSGARVRLWVPIVPVSDSRGVQGPGNGGA